MKKTDVALIILIVGIVGLATFILVNTLVGEPGAEPVQVETAEPIVTEVTEPSKAVFNDKAINPTVKVKIGNQSNQQPFTLGQQ